MSPPASGEPPAGATIVRVEPTLAGLEPARLAVLSALGEPPLAEAARFRLELVLEELLSNAVRHGRVGHLSVSVWREPGRVRLRVEDDGPPFDPTAWQADAAAPQDVTAASTGGRGVLLVHRYASALTYRRVLRTNRLDVALADR